MTDLTEYVRDLIRKGYSIEQIRSTLLQYHYPPHIVDQAIYMSTHEVKHTIHLTKTTLAAVAIIVLGIIVSAFFIFKDTSPQKSLLDVEISDLDTNVKAGEFFSASIDLTNMGSKTREDIYLKSEIFNENTDERIAFKTSEIALQTTSSQTIEIKIPEDTAAGSYILKVTARLSKQAPSATASFKVDSTKTETSCDDGIQNQEESGVDCGGPCEACQDSCPQSCDDDIQETIDYCDASTNFKCVHKKPAICGDNSCTGLENENNCPDDCMASSPGTVWDDLDRISELANKDCSGAKQQCSSLPDDFLDKCLQSVGEICQDPTTCDKIEDQNSRERCFMNVAKSLNKSVLCENIEHEDRRNSCYIYFAVEGDYSVCEKITNPNVKRSCDTLNQIGQ